MSTPVRGSNQAQRLSIEGFVNIEINQPCSKRLDAGLEHQSVVQSDTQHRFPSTRLTTTPNTSRPTPTLVSAESTMVYKMNHQLAQNSACRRSFTPTFQGGIMVPLDLGAVPGPSRFASLQRQALLTLGSPMVCLGVSAGLGLAPQLASSSDHHMHRTRR